MTDLPEPVMHKTMWGDLFTATQMREYRNAALEEAAKECDKYRLIGNDDERWGAQECAAAVRNLIGEVK